jgi:hypothetical protein
MAASRAQATGGFISKQMLYLELDAEGGTRHIAYAPYLDYRPLAPGEPGVEALLERPECAWITRELEHRALGHAIADVVPLHLAEVRGPRLALLAKTEAAVKDRLTKEITYWDHRAEELRAQEHAGKVNARLLGFEPTDRELDKLGYDIESRIPGTGRLRFIEVKGRETGADVITVTRNEILYSLNKPDDFILAIVEFVDAGRERILYLRQPFHREPDFAETSRNYQMAELIARGAPPS